ncbi:MAG: DUF1634 domain-containing protein [Myxococcaceae bacterium]
MSEPVVKAQAAPGTVASAEVWISGLLRYGVATSMAVVMLGMLLSFLRHPEYSSSADALARLTNPELTPRSLGALVGEASNSPGQTIVMFGLLLLIALPVARVALSLWLFRLAGDRTYLKVTAVVLVLLTVSFFLGAVH